ncbi:MAG: phosphoribosylglycinamide formyltransferase [Phycisphaeraceae bacterium]
MTLSFDASADRPTRLGIFISGGGTTMLNLAEQIKAGKLDAEIGVVISSRADAAGVARAQQTGLATHVVSRKDYASVEAFSDAVWQVVDRYEIDLVCMAGFLSLLRIPERYLGRVMNIHPSLLPKFGGKGMFGRHVHEAVIAAGESESGCTVHFANNAYDQGPIILQRRCPVLPDDTAETLAERVFEQECLAYPEAIRMIQSGEVRYDIG